MSDMRMFSFIVLLLPLFCLSSSHIKLTFSVGTYFAETYHSKQSPTFSYNIYTVLSIDLFESIEHEYGSLESFICHYHHHQQHKKNNRP